MLQITHFFSIEKCYLYILHNFYVFSLIKLLFVPSVFSSILVFQADLIRDQSNKLRIGRLAFAVADRITK